MAEVHNQLYRGIWNAAITRALGVTKKPGGLERYSETLQPVIDLWLMPEWFYLREDVLGTFFNSSAAVPAEFSFLGIGPIAGQLLIVDRVAVRGAQPVQIGLQARTVVAATGTLGGIVTQNRDSRYQPNAVTATRNPPVEVWTGSDPGSITGGLSEEVIATAAAYFEMISPPWVVKPGTVLLVQGGTVNVALQANFRFRVRAALPGELGA